MDFSSSPYCSVLDGWIGPDGVNGLRDRTQPGRSRSDPPQVLSLSQARAVIQELHDTLLLKDIEIEVLVEALQHAQTYHADCVESDSDSTN